jgi:hypothetical protein
MWQRDQHSPGGIRQISISRVSNNSLSWILLGDVLCFFGIGPQRLLQHPKWLSRISQIDSRQYFLPEKNERNTWRHSLQAAILGSAKLKTKMTSFLRIVVIQNGDINSTPLLHYCCILMQGECICRPKVTIFLNMQ